MAAVIKQPLDIEQYKVNGIEPINAQDMVEHSLNTTEQIDDATTRGKQHRWLPGESGNPSGRTLGSKNRKQLESDFYADLADDWRKYGNQAIVAMRLDNPAKYCQLVASILPKALEIDTDGHKWVINAAPSLSTGEWLAMHGLNQASHDTHVIDSNEQSDLIESDQVD